MNDRMSGNGEETKRDSSRRGKLRAFLYLCLIVVVLFAAWQAHLLFFTDPDRSESGPPPLSSLRAGTATTTTQPASSPVGNLFDPLRELGLNRVEEDPGNFPPPAGATRSRAFEKQFRGERTLHAAYYLQGDLLQAAEHYRRLAAERDFKLVRNSEADNGVLTLLFLRDQSRLRVVLRKSPRNAKMVILSVLFTRPVDGAQRP
ncbi:MAG: hypothetical protein ACLFVU_07785 [Phycisphaerae bacterium]